VSFFSNTWLSPYAVPYLAVAVLVLLLGVFVFFHDRRSATNLSYFLVCLNTFLWLICNYLAISSTQEPTALFWSKLVYLGITFIPPSMYFFSVAWLQLREQRKYVLLYYGLGAVFVLLFLDTGLFVVGVHRYYFGYFSRLSPAAAIYLAYFFWVSAHFFRNLYKAYRNPQETRTLRKVHIRRILIAFLVAFMGSVDFWTTYGFPVYPISFLTVGLFAFIVAQSIISHKLMNIETVIHRTVMWFLSTVTAVVPFAFLISGSRAWVSGFAGAYQTVFYLSLFISFFYYFRIVQPYLDHLFRRRHANLQAVAVQFSSELVHLKNLGDLLRRFVRMLRRSLYAKQAAVYLRQEDGKQFVPAIAKGMRGLKPVAADHPVMLWLERSKEIVVANLTGTDPELEAFRVQAEQFFSETQALVTVPLCLGEKMIGFVSLGKRENLKRYSVSEVAFLAQIRAPVTIAFSNSTQFDNVSQLYKQVQTQNERLQELDRLKSEFLANTSHELRTPLNGILGLIETVLDGADGPVNEKQRRHLAMIMESGTGLKELISNLLELSRMESGQASLNIKAFNVVNVIDAVMVLMEGVAHKKNLALLRDVPVKLPDVYGDPEKIQRVLLNLVGNAVKFTESGSVTVAVTEGEQDVRIDVADTGIGINPAEQKIIFDRFRQADGSSTRRYEGTGLGLSIASEIIQLHGGRIEVESREGAGSRFYFALPKRPFEAPSSSRRPAVQIRLPDELAASPSDAQDDAAYALEKDEEFREAVRGSGETILMIDDNAVNREVVRTRLEMHHYRVIEAADGQDGLAEVEREKPDLVILDLMMPRMSGYEFCKKLRNVHGADELPVIILTAKTDVGDKVYGLQIGANDYIAKPFNKEELIARVSILLRVRKMTRELRKWNLELEARVDERTRQLVRTQEQLIQAEKMATIGVMAGGVAHEINNPLTAILTNAQLLKMCAPEQDAESLKLIEEGARRCQTIVQKLMKYARKSSGADEYHDAVDLGQVVRNAVSMLQYQLAQENIELKLEIADALYVEGSANELEQVLTNLLVNGRDAIQSAKRRGTIHIRAAGGEDGIRVTVSDDGIGIPKENLNKIFDPFFTTKEVGQGTGLGLAVSYSILEKHHSQVAVESTVGQGTTFTLKFKPMRK